ncbi:riboflavin synthase [Chlamydiota bacterium]
MRLVVFTGIIEDVGTISAIRSKNGKKEIEIEHKFENLSLGESVSVNGVCLTVSSIVSGKFRAELLFETEKSTNLKYFKKGAKINLERALKAGDRVGGHFVTGHVDEVGNVTLLKNRYEKILKIQIIDENAKYLVSKGSIAINGVSLTVVDIGKNYFTVHIIPHTSKYTILEEVSNGDKVNIEYDILAKYGIRNNPSKSHEINLSFLKKNGF